MELEHQQKNLYEYHNVFASALAAYITAKAAFDSEKSAQVRTSRFEEAKSILHSNILYAITLKRNDVENEGIPKDERELVRWLGDYEAKLKNEGNTQEQILDTLYVLMVRKQDVAGLTPAPEKNMTSRMNMLISQVEKEMKRGGDR